MQHKTSKILRLFEQNVESLFKSWKPIALPHAWCFLTVDWTSSRFPFFMLNTNLNFTRHSRQFIYQFILPSSYNEHRTWRKRSSNITWESSFITIMYIKLLPDVDCFIIPKSPVNAHAILNPVSHMAITWSSWNKIFILTHVMSFTHLNKKDYPRGKLDVISCQSTSC